MRLSTILVYALLTVAAGIMIAFAIGAYAGFGQVISSIFGTAIMLIISLGAAVACAIALERQVAPRLMLSGLIANAVALAVSVVTLWFDLLNTYPHLPRLVVWPGVWALAAALLGLLLIPRSPGPWWSVLRRLSIVLLLILAVYSALAVTFAPLNAANFSAWREYEEIAMRVFFVLLTPFLGLFAATFLTLWMMPRPSESRREPLWLTCPRCNTEQTLTTGGARCATCGLGIRVSVL